MTEQPDQQQHDAWFEQMQQRQEQTWQLIQANSEAIAELRQQQQADSDLLREKIGNLSTMITTLIDQMQIDRQETTLLRAEVRSLIQALRDRFGGNGQSRK